MVHDHTTKTTFETVALFVPKSIFESPFLRQSSFFCMEETHTSCWTCTTVLDFLQKDSKFHINVYHHLMKKWTSLSSNLSECPCKIKSQQSHYYQGTDAKTDYRMKHWNKGLKEWNGVPGVAWTKADVEVIENVSCWMLQCPLMSPGQNSKPLLCSS